MTHPNLLRAVRSCAKWRSGALLVATLMACTPANAGPVRVHGPSGTLDLAAPGDTLRYVLSAPAVPGATSYIWNVTGTPGVWGGLPINLTTTSPSVSFAAIAPASWDSVTFAVTFQGKSANRSSNVIPGTWKVKRMLVATGPITVDSSGVGPISLIVAPSAVPLAIGDLAQLCAFWQFGSGHVAMRTIDGFTCGAIHENAFSAFQRAVTIPEQGYVDARCDWPACLLGFAPRPSRMPADAVRVSL